MFNQGKFLGTIREKGSTVAKAAGMMGINESTLYRKMDRDGDFSREEILSFREGFGLTSEEMDAIFFASELT